MMLIWIAACRSGVEGLLGVPCDGTPDSLDCPHDTLGLHTGWSGLSVRQVHWQVPEGTAPLAGWPVAILFQGSLYSAETFWSATPDDAFGRWHQVRLVESLLGAGFAVVTPEARLGGLGYWDTNVPPFSLLWSTAPDHQVMLDLFAAIAVGDLGPLDPDALYAAGISSGGYMTSRMAVSYPGRFRALAIQSASYATCSGPLCVLPQQMPSDHPPTMFLVGENDLVVPPRTSEGYHDALADQGIAVAWEADPEVGHAWISVAPDAITDWFTEGFVDVP